MNKINIMKIKSKSSETEATKTRTQIKFVSAFFKNHVPDKL